MNSVSESQRERQTVRRGVAGVEDREAPSLAGEVVAEREPGLATSDDDHFVAVERGVHHADPVLEGVKRASTQAAEQHEQRARRRRRTP